MFVVAAGKKSQNSVGAAHLQDAFCYPEPIFLGEGSLSLCGSRGHFSDRHPNLKCLRRLPKSQATSEGAASLIRVIFSRILNALLAASVHCTSDAPSTFRSAADRIPNNTV